MKLSVSEVDSTISPLIQKINYAILVLSTASLLGARDYLVFIPNNVVNLAKDRDSFPYVWTLLTSAFIEENLASLAVFLALANYIVIQNRASLE
jgi:hypothetical protein